MTTYRCDALKSAHKKRRRKITKIRYRKKHPSHRMKYGHNFRPDKACDGKVCLKCGKGR